MVCRQLYKNNGLAPILGLAIVLLLSSCGAAQPGQRVLKFDFGSGAVEDGFVQVVPTTEYDAERGYGFERGATITAVDRGAPDAMKRDFVTSDKPFLFSVRVPEGNYKITMTLGDSQGESVTTVKAELRRLILEKVATSKGQFKTETIIVNTRTTAIAGDGAVRLKKREKLMEMAAWDDKLTLEFNNVRPCLCGMEIQQVDDVATVYLLGDSTVCDQPSEPWNSWGQMLTRFFKPEVAIANHAESGESIRSSLGAGRFKKVYSVLKKGDYVFLQFGHNDMKSKSPDALQTYKSNLLEIVVEVKKRGATPVLITSMERKSGVVNDTLAGYPGAVRQVAAETDSALIDLHAMSKVLYAALGDDLDKAFQDGTHHNAYGSYQLAQCVVQGVVDNKLELTEFVVDDFSGYDPAKPDSVEGFEVPASPARDMEKPLGS